MGLDDCNTLFLMARMMPITVKAKRKSSAMPGGDVRKIIKRTFRGRTVINTVCLSLRSSDVSALHES